MASSLPTAAEAEDWNTYYLYRGKYNVYINIFGIYNAYAKYITTI